MALWKAKKGIKVSEKPIKNAKNVRKTHLKSNKKHKTVPKRRKNHWNRRNTTEKEDNDLCSEYAVCG